MSLLRTVFVKPFLKIKTNFSSSSNQVYELSEINTIINKSRTLYCKKERSELYIKIIYSSCGKKATVISKILYDNNFLAKSTYHINHLQIPNKIKDCIDYFESTFSIPVSEKIILIEKLKSFIDEKGLNNEAFYETLYFEFSKKSSYALFALLRLDNDAPLVIKKVYFIYQEICWEAENLLFMDEILCSEEEKMKKSDFCVFFTEALPSFPNNIIKANIRSYTYQENKGKYFHELAIKGNEHLFRFVFIIDKNTKTYTFNIFKVTDNIEENFSYYPEKPKEEELFFSSIKNFRLEKFPFSQHTVFDRFEINDDVADVILDICYTYLICPNFLEELEMNLPLNNKQIEVIKLLQY